MTTAMVRALARTPTTRNVMRMEAATVILNAVTGDWYSLQQRKRYALLNINWRTTF